jgi:uroporphyrin-III C-methyltransferase
MLFPEHVRAEDIERQAKTACAFTILRKQTVKKVDSGLRSTGQCGYISLMNRTPHLPPVVGDWPELLPGWVWLVGAGPGDPGLMTLHALNALEQADVIVYDALVDNRILDWARPEAEVEYAGKRGGKPSPKQRDISLRLSELARLGKRVLRLKGGDPFIFGRGGEEAQALVQAGIPIRIVPGITAGVAGLAYAGIPATHRDVNQAVTFFTGHDHTGEAPGALDWAALAKSSPVLIGYMAIKTLPSISANLIAAGRSVDEPVAIIMDATLPTMRVLETTLGCAVEDLAASGLEPPAILCIGRVALMRQALDWIGQMAGEAPRNLDPLGSDERDAG